MLLKTAILALIFGACLLTAWSARAQEDAPAVPRRYVISAVFFIAFWLGPVLSFGLTRQPLPGLASLSYFHNVTDLFSVYWSDWALYAVQVRPAGETDWVTLPEEGYNELAAFGGLDRFVLYMWFSHGAGEQDAERRRVILRWFNNRYRKLNPGKPPAEELRIVFESSVPRRDHPPTSAWKRPESDRAVDWQVLHTEDAS